MLYIATIVVQPTIVVLNRFNFINNYLDQKTTNLNEKKNSTTKDSNDFEFDLFNITQLKIKD